MPEFKSVTYTAQETAQNDAGKIIADAALISGKQQIIQCEVLIPAGTATADTILLGFIPAGATIVPGQCSITIPEAAGAGLLDIGYAGAVDAIAADVDVSTAGSYTLFSLVGNHKNTDRQALIATLSDAITSAKTLYLNIAYYFAE